MGAGAGLLLAASTGAVALGPGVGSVVGSGERVGVASRDGVGEAAVSVALGVAVPVGSTEGSPIARRQVAVNDASVKCKRNRADLLRGADFIRRKQLSSFRSFHTGREMAGVHTGGPRAENRASRSCPTILLFGWAWRRLSGNPHDTARVF